MSSIDKLDGYSQKRGKKYNKSVSSDDNESILIKKVCLIVDCVVNFN